jgi:nicotinate-nucleotide pyrophosphorylase (carboxylating)
VPDGKKVAGSTAIARVDGDASVILASERVFLNFLGFMTGIATLTRQYVDAVKGMNCSIMDTRKTTPMLRALEKYAVRTGGGTNHRYGLYDQILVKDNHLKLFHMDVAEATRRARAYRDENLSGSPVEIEVEAVEQMIEAVRNGADIVLLDNMTPMEVAEAVRRRNSLKSKAQLEVSGGVTLENVRAYAETGVERISIGRLTHSAPAADVALDVG